MTMITIIINNNNNNLSKCTKRRNPEHECYMSLLTVLYCSRVVFFMKFINK